MKNPKEKREGWARIPNKLLEYNGLTWQAKGLLAYMISRPFGWKFSIGDFVNRSEQGRKPVYKILGELMEKGFIKRIQFRDEKTKLFGASNYVFNLEKIASLVEMRVKKPNDNPANLENLPLPPFRQAEVRQAEKETHSNTEGDSNTGSYVSPPKDSSSEESPPVETGGKVDNPQLFEGEEKVAVEQPDPPKTGKDTGNPPKTQPRAKEPLKTGKEILAAIQLPEHLANETVRQALLVWIEHRMRYPKPRIGWEIFFQNQINAKLAEESAEIAVASLIHCATNGYQGLFVSNSFSPRKRQSQITPTNENPFWYVMNFYAAKAEVVKQRYDGFPSHWIKYIDPSGKVYFVKPEHASRPMPEGFVKATEKQPNEHNNGEQKNESLAETSTV